MQTESKNADKADAQPTIAEIPKVNVEVDVEVPQEIWEQAEERVEKAREGHFPDAALEDYLLDQVRFEYNFQKADGRADE